MNMNNEKTNSLTTQIEAVTNKLTELKNEQSEFQPRMTSAVGAGDSAAMINLRRRQGEVPIEIALTEIELAKLQLQSDQERLPVLKAKVSKFAEPIPGAVLKRDAAVLELNKLQDQYRTADEDFRDLRLRIGQRTRELERLIYMANPAREIPGTRLRSLNAA
jgi:chromosome segregation ATPase